MQNNNTANCMQVKTYHKLVQRCQLRSEENWRCQQAGQQEHYGQEQNGAQGPHLRENIMRIGILKILRRNVFSFLKINRVFYSKEIKYEKHLLGTQRNALSQYMVQLKGLCHQNFYLGFMCSFQHCIIYDRLYIQESLLKN